MAKETNTAITVMPVAKEMKIFTSQKDVRLTLKKELDEKEQEIDDAIAAYHAVVIADDVSMQIKATLLADLNKGLIYIEDLRKKTNEPYRVSVEAINEAFYVLRDKLKDTIKEGKDTIATWEEEQREVRRKALAAARKQQEEEAKQQRDKIEFLRRISDQMVDYFSEVSKMINEATTKEQLKEIYDTKVNVFPDYFEEMPEHKRLILKDLNHLGVQCWNDIKAGKKTVTVQEVSEAAADIKNALQESIDTTMANDKAQSSAAMAAAEVKALEKSPVVTRTSVKARIPENTALVDKMFWSVDPEKVEAFRKNHVEKLKELLNQADDNGDLPPSVIAKGIEFYLEITTIAR